MCWELQGYNIHFTWQSIWSRYVPIFGMRGSIRYIYVLIDGDNVPFWSGDPHKNWEKILEGGETPEKKTLGHGSVSRDSTFQGSLNSFDSADFEVVWWGPKEQARLMMGCGPRQGYSLF